MCSGEAEQAALGRRVQGARAAPAPRLPQQTLQEQIQPIQQQVIE